MAETDTVFDEVDEIVLDRFEYDTKSSMFVIHLSGSASGSHRREAGIPGQGIDISIEATCRSVVGEFGLSEHDIDASASPTSYE